MGICGAAEEEREKSEELNIELESVPYWCLIIY